MNMLTPQGDVGFIRVQEPVSAPFSVFSLPCASSLGVAQPISAGWCSSTFAAQEPCGRAGLSWERLRDGLGALCSAGGHEHPSALPAADMNQPVHGEALQVNTSTL